MQCRRTNITDVWGLQACEEGAAEPGGAKSAAADSPPAEAGFLATPGSGRRAGGSKRARLAHGARPRSYRL